MDQPTTLQAALEAITAANGRIAMLESDLKAANDLVENAGALQEQIKSLTHENSELEQKVFGLEGENKRLTEKASLSEIKLNEAIAAAGVPPVAVQQSPVQENKEQLWAQFRALSVYDRPAFWAKNKHILTA